jgi:acido-empty-quinoprotein group A
VNLRQWLLGLSVALIPAVFCAPLFGQGLDPAAIVHPPAGTWPTYNGDYSGQRYSPLTQVNRSNVASLTLAWEWHLQSNPFAGAGGIAAAISSVVKATPLVVNGVLYFSTPDNVFAVDARTGEQIWHYEYPPNEGLHIGSRGVGMYGEWLYFETPDNFLICLDAKTGKVRWKQELADVKLDYFSTMAPVVIRNHVIASVGGDTLDNTGYLEARDPETGALQWQWFTEPRPGEPGSETWPNAGAMEHGGGMPWMPGTYDPELNLIYWGIGNPNPVHAGAGRMGANLWTDSIVAINPDTGKLVWYYQTTPHDTHDWDSVQTPILIDGTFNGRPRKMLAQANRSGFFYLLDRTNGEHLLTAPFVGTNWSTGKYDAQGRPIANPEKEPSHDGVLVCPSSGGATNWMAPTFNPATGYFYVLGSHNCSIFYLTAEGKGEGFAGRDLGLGGGTNYIEAIAYNTGKVAWKFKDGSGGGLLSTAGQLLFGSDDSGNLLALDPASGRVLWHSRIGRSTSNPPITYELDGRQYVLFGVGDTLLAFTLPR